MEVGVGLGVGGYFVVGLGRRIFTSRTIYSMLLIVQCIVFVCLYFQKFNIHLFIYLVLVCGCVAFAMVSVSKVRE